MAIIVGHGGTRNVNTITNRTGQSGGSIGGDKKAGTWSGQPFMSVYNVGNSYTYRIPQKMPSLRQLFTSTTRFPLQLQRGSYSVTHAGTLLG